MDCPKCSGQMAWSSKLRSLSCVTCSHSEYVPKAPTSGWMMTTLERHGVPARGIGYKDSQLVRMLRERGYDVAEKA